METVGKQEETAKQSNTSDWQFPTIEDGVRFPKTKGKAIEYRQLQANVSLSRNLMNNLVAYHQSIGADKDLPTGKKKLFGYMNRFHMQLAIKNPHWPEDLPFGYVYGAFINAVMYGKTELKGYNIKANVSAFRKWITKEGVEDNLYRSYYNANPDAMPKQLEGRDTVSEETKEIIAEGYVDFPPHVVESQVKKIEMMWGTMQNALESFQGAKSYVHRLYNTYEKYKKEEKI